MRNDNTAILTSFKITGIKFKVTEKLVRMAVLSLRIIMLITLQYLTLQKDDREQIKLSINQLYHTSYVVNIVIYSQHLHLFTTGGSIFFSEYNIMR